MSCLIFRAGRTLYILLRTEHPISPLSDAVTYDRISIFLDWENGDEATAT